MISRSSKLLQYNVLVQIIITTCFNLILIYYGFFKTYIFTLVDIWFIIISTSGNLYFYISITLAQIKKEPYLYGSFLYN